MLFMLTLHTLRHLMFGEQSFKESASRPNETGKHVDTGMTCTSSTDKQAAVLTLEMDDAQDNKAMTRRMLLLSMRIEMGTS